MLCFLNSSFTFTVFAMFIQNLQKVFIEEILLTSSDTYRLGVYVRKHICWIVITTNSMHFISSESCSWLWRRYEHFFGSFSSLTIETLTLVIIHLLRSIKAVCTLVVNILLGFGSTLHKVCLPWNFSCFVKISYIWSGSRVCDLIVILMAISTIFIL